LTFDDADTVSLSALRNYFFDVDKALEDGTGEVVTYEDLQLDGGFRGSHLVANLSMSDGGAMTTDQTILLDQATTKLYALIVSCSSVCYERNSGDIKKVVESWTVRDKCPPVSRADCHDHDADTRTRQSSTRAGDT